MIKLIVWKDTVMFKWDGVFPANIPPEHAQNHWVHLKGFAHFAKKSKNHVLSLSAGNIDRIFLQFGKENVGYANSNAQLVIEKLLEARAKFKSMCQHAASIQSAPIEVLPKYDYKAPPLAPYQHRGVVMLTEVPRMPLFADCGMGKTFMTLVSTEIQIKKGIIPRGKTLICAKLATLESGWLEDVQKFTDLKLVNLWIASGYKRKEKFLELLNSEGDAYLINHEGVLAFKDALVEKKFNKIIVDESTILKGYRGSYGGRKTGKIGQALLDVAYAAHWRVIMTGTPAPNGPEDLWGQIHFLDPKGNLLERQFNEFQQLYFDAQRFSIGSKKVCEWKPRHDTFDRVSSRIAPLMYRLKIRDNLELPELTKMKRMIYMVQEQKHHYKDLNEFLATVINDERILTPVKVVQLMKLRQVTGGFLIDHEDKSHALSVNPKIEELDSILEDEISVKEKVVIYAQYRWEINLIENRYKKYGSVSVYGENSAQKNLANIKSFIEDPKIRIIVLHPKSAAHGITFTVAHYMVFYSLSYSEENHYQCVKRIERAGQKNSMIVMYLLCKGTIDEIIFSILQEKANDQSKLIDVEERLITEWRIHGT